MTTSHDHRRPSSLRKCGMKATRHHRLPPVAVPPLSIDPGAAATFIRLKVASGPEQRRRRSRGGEFIIIISSFPRCRRHPHLARLRLRDRALAAPPIGIWRYDNQTDGRRCRRSHSRYAHGATSLAIAADGEDSALAFCCHSAPTCQQKSAPVLSAACRSTSPATKATPSRPAPR